MAARLAAIASLGAAVIHFAAVPAHWQEWVPSGLFFVSIALFQLMWSRAVLTRPSTVVLAAGIVGNVGAAALWALSRTAGAPFGPHAGEPEMVQAAGLCALLLEIYVVMGAGWVWYRGREAEPIPAFANAMVFLGLGVVILSAATAGVASGLQPGHHAPAGAEVDHHASNSEHADGHHDHPKPVAPLNIEAVPPPAAPLPVEPLDLGTGTSHSNDDEHHHSE